MLLTEEEVKVKECRVGGPEVIRRVGDYEQHRDFPKCIGSACMSWRWDVERLHRPNLQNIEFDGLKAAGWEKAAGREDMLERRSRGYCGIAGRPE